MSLILLYGIWFPHNDHSFCWLIFDIVEFFYALNISLFFIDVKLLNYLFLYIKEVFELYFVFFLLQALCYWTIRNIHHNVRIL